MTQTIQLTTTTQTGGAKGMMGVLKRAVGGDGLFLAKMSGPGRVWLQTLTLSGLAGALQPYLVQGEATSGGLGGVIGGLLNQ